MKLNLKCFSHVKHALGCDQMALEMPEGSTAADLVARVREQAGAALEGIPLRVAVDGDFVAEDAPLRDGGEVALIPPVQGG